MEERSPCLTQSIVTTVLIFPTPPSCRARSATCTASSPSTARSAHAAAAASPRLQPREAEFWRSVALVTAAPGSVARHATTGPDDGGESACCGIVTAMACMACCAGACGRRSAFHHGSTGQTRASRGEFGSASDGSREGRTRSSGGLGCGRACCSFSIGRTRATLSRCAECYKPE